MLSLRKVKGTSMYPALVDSDYIVINHFFWQLSAGDIVVVDHPIYQYIIKRIVTIANNGDLWLKGDNISSVKPEMIGWIKQRWIKGKVIYTISS